MHHILRATEDGAIRDRAQGPEIREGGIALLGLAGAGGAAVVVEHRVGDDALGEAFCRAILAGAGARGAEEVVIFHLRHLAGAVAGEELTDADDGIILDLGRQADQAAELFRGEGDPRGLRALFRDGAGAGDEREGRAGGELRQLEDRSAEGQHGADATGEAVLINQLDDIAGEVGRERDIGRGECRLSLDIEAEDRLDLVAIQLAGGGLHLRTGLLDGTGEVERTEILGAALRDAIVRTTADAVGGELLLLVGEHLLLKLVETGLRLGLLIFHELQLLSDAIEALKALIELFQRFGDLLVELAGFISDDAKMKRGSLEGRGEHVVCDHESHSGKPLDEGGAMVEEHFHGGF